MKYIMDNEKNEDCVFCHILAESDDTKNLVLYRAEHSFVILNRYPYNTGHLMIVPNQHNASIDELDSQTLHEMMELLSQAVSILKKVYNPQGFNIGANLGSAAGAGIAEHVHFHIVPRWGGDTNFITSLADTRIIPEDLSETYQRIRDVCEECSEWVIS